MNPRRWATVAVILAVLGAAYFFRYERVMSGENGLVIMWDRWLQRPCIIRATPVCEYQ